jgi:hypothetical protein
MNRIKTVKIITLTRMHWQIHVEINKGKSLFRPLIDKIKLAEIRTCYYQVSRQKLDDLILDLTFTNMPQSQKPRPFVVMLILDFSLNVSAGSQCQMSKGNVFFFTPNTWIGKVITSGPFCGPFPNFAAMFFFFFPPCLSLFSPFLLPTSFSISFWR